MKELRVECGDVSMRAGMRPGTMVVIMTDPGLKRFDAPELLGQMDIKDVMEWLSEQGYTIQREAA